MSKRNTYRDDLDYEDEYVNERRLQEEQRERRKLKRLRNALKTKNIRDIQFLDDEY